MNKIVLRLFFLLSIIIIVLSLIKIYEKEVSVIINDLQYNVKVNLFVYDDKGILLNSEVEIDESLFGYLRFPEQHQEIMPSNFFGSVTCNMEDAVVLKYGKGTFIIWFKCKSNGVKIKIASNGFRSISYWIDYNGSKQTDVFMVRC